MFREADRSVDTVSLNPFEFRAGICLWVRTNGKTERSLNPFEFRAGICLFDAIKTLSIIRLNPFEFRAGICLYLRQLVQLAVQS